MKTNDLLLATTFVIGSLLTPAYAQVPTIIGTTQAKGLPGTAGDTSPKGTAKITGFVVDSTQATKAVEFASIALYNKSTGKAVDGTVADEKGKFTLTKVAAGDYKLLISFVGFDNKTINNLTLTDGQSLDLGDIQLGSTARLLKEVVVTGQAAVIEEKVDRLVYHADKDISAKGGDATDILRKVPLLAVDPDGNVSLRGSGNIRVLINNKPSTIVAGSVADALKQIPADQIKTVEVITSPSAKYDAEGAAGVINIITQKNSLQGLSLTVDGGAGNRNANLSLNGGYRKGKAGFTIGGSGRAQYNTPLRLVTEQSSQVNGISSMSRQTGTGTTEGLYGQYNLGFDYELAKNQSLTAGVRYGLRNSTNRLSLLTSQFANGMAGLTTGRDVDTKNLSNTIDLNVDYLHTFKPQQEWSISTLYSRNNLANNFDANLFSGNGELGGRQQNLNDNVNQEFTLQSDYQMPLTKQGILEVGAKGILRQVNSDSQYLIAESTGGFSTDAGQPAAGLLYNQNIAAGYSSFTYSTKRKYTLKAGLRYEYTAIDASTRNGAVDLKDYGTLVPSLNVAKTINGTSVKLGYNRRIQRPGLQQLNPNFNSANPQNITVGNPELRPELINNFELGLSRSIRKTFVTAAFFGRISNNTITQLRRPSDTLAGAIVTTYANVGRQYTYGTNLFANIAVTGKINVGLFFNGLYTSLTGQVMGENGLSTSLTNSGFNLSGGTFVSAQIKNGWGVQGFGLVQGSQVQLQGTQGGFGFYSLAVKKEFASKRTSIGLAAENFLSPDLNIHSVLNSAQFNQVSDVYVAFQGVRLTFTHKIGKVTTDAPRKKAKSVNNDDVKSDNTSQTPGGSTPAGGASPRQ